MPDGQPSVWRFIALVLVAIAVWIYVFSTFRAQRRKKQNLPPDDPYTVTLGKIEFPELNHLRESERETILRSSVEDPEVRNFANQMGRFGKIMFYVIIVICIAVAITIDLPVWLLTLGAFATFFTIMIIRV